MKRLFVALAAAGLLFGFGAVPASAQHRHHHFRHYYGHHGHHYYHRGPGIWFGIGGPRLYHGPRYRPRHCWFERRHRRDHHGRRHSYTVKVCR